MALTTTWWWIRHGPTHASVLAGWTDLPADLSDKAALARLSGRIPEEAAVVSSDLSRAKCTADGIVGRRTRLPDAWELREINFGDWDGMPHGEISEAYPGELEAFLQRPDRSAPPGGESWNEVARRVSDYVDRTTSEREGGHIAAVAHFGVILTQVQRANGQDFPDLVAEPVANLSVTRISVSDGRWKLEEFSTLP